MNITVMSYGGGTNSTAMLIGLHERGERPDFITFADTGSEQEYTYRHMGIINDWCKRNDFPTIIVLKPTQPQMVKDGSLLVECERLGRLPSKAYGNGSCSLKWKVEPQNHWNRKLAIMFGIAPSEIVRLVGYDTDEINRYHRALRLAENQPTRLRFPLIEWGWGRDDCVKAIFRAGLPQPGKSSCVMCPSMTKQEIIKLSENYPEVFKRIVEMEHRAMAGEGRAPASKHGLGRRFTWGNFIKDYRKNQIVEDDECSLELDCGCYDGE